LTKSAEAISEEETLNPKHEILNNIKAPSIKVQIPHVIARSRRRRSNLGSPVIVRTEILHFAQNDREM
jgi:hypothetical protein